MLSDFHELVKAATAKAIHAVAHSDVATARDVIGMEADISRISDSAAAHQASRLVASEPKRIPAYTIEIDIIEKQKRIYYFAKRMAESVSLLDAAEGLKDMPELAG